MGKTKHGMRKTRFYTIWVSMKQRCTNANSKDYPRYGGNGITLDDSWYEFENFMQDMKGSYDLHVAIHGEQNTQIDRADNELGYSPDNCRWVTILENLNNRRNYAAVGTNGRKTNWGKNGRR